MKCSTNENGVGKNGPFKNEGNLQLQWTTITTPWEQPKKLENCSSVIFCHLLPIQFQWCLTGSILPAHLRILNLFIKQGFQDLQVTSRGGKGKPQKVLTVVTPVSRGEVGYVNVYSAYGVVKETMTWTVERELFPLNHDGEAERVYETPLKNGGEDFV